MNPMSGIESRMGLLSVEELLAERDELIREVAPLRAKHGPFGSWGDLRKALLSTIAMGIRADNSTNGVKMTESAVDDMAHADQRYKDFIESGTIEKATWIIKESQIESIDFTIQRGQVVARYLASEPR